MLPTALRHKIITGAKTCQIVLQNLSVCYTRILPKLLFEGTNPSVSTNRLHRQFAGQRYSNNCFLCEAKSYAVHYLTAMALAGARVASAFNRCHQYSTDAIQTPQTAAVGSPQLWSCAVKSYTAVGNNNW